MELSQLNDVSESDAREKLTKCCGASKWVDKMMSARPFASDDDLRQKADAFMDQLERDDWLEAFTHHPKIGDVEVLRQKFNPATKWEAGEQSGVATASEVVLNALASANKLYEKRYGYIFIVCATGKSANEMLHILRARLANNPNEELKIAANEQRKITHLRLEKACQ